jgi:hypothetical protein
MSRKAIGVIGAVACLVPVSGGAGFALRGEISVGPGSTAVFGPQRAYENQWYCANRGVMSSGYVRIDCVDSVGWPQVRMMVRASVAKIVVTTCPAPKLQGQMKCHFQRAPIRGTTAFHEPTFTFVGP